MATNLTRLHDILLERNPELVKAVHDGLTKWYAMRQTKGFSTIPFTPAQIHVGFDPNLPFNCKAVLNNIFMGEIEPNVVKLLDDGDRLADSVSAEILAAEKALFAGFGAVYQQTHLENEHVRLFRRLLDNHRHHLKINHRIASAGAASGEPLRVNIVQAFVHFTPPAPATAATAATT